MQRVQRAPVHRGRLRGGRRGHLPTGTPAPRATPRAAPSRGRPRNSTGRRAFSGDVDSPQQSKQLPRNDPPGPVVVSCGTPCGCVFRDSPSGSRARGDEDEKGYGGVLGTGTRARLHGAAARRDPKYLD